MCRCSGCSECGAAALDGAMFCDACGGLLAFTLKTSGRAFDARR
jgi:hypothetical protein